MAKSLNRGDQLGYLGDDIRIKEFRDGTSVGEVAVATNYGVKSASGEWTERTEWHAVVIWVPLPRPTCGSRVPACT